MCESVSDDWMVSVKRESENKLARDELWIDSHLATDSQVRRELARLSRALSRARTRREERAHELYEESRGTT